MMSDLTDKRNELIIIKPDAKTLTAINAETSKWTTTEKLNVTVKDGYVFSQPDPLGVMDEKREALIGLVDTNAEAPTDVVRIRFSGTEAVTLAFISQNVGPIPEEPK
jgi:hypothetical protein